MCHLKTVTALILFWLLLSGHYSALLLTLGALAVALVMWFVRRMDQVDGDRVRLRAGRELAGYLLWLGWSVIRSNIDVARRVWTPSLPIRPTWGRLDIRVDTPMQKTLYANSITLTPGTLTAEVGDDYFLVHALSEEGLEELRGGEMERRVLASGI